MYSAIGQQRGVNMKIQEYLKNNNIIADGAFGTYYAEKYGTREMPELANTEHPERVCQIHKEYIEAGAVLIRTNTFEANTVSLSCDTDSVTENVKAAVAAAKKAASEYRTDSRPVFIAGDIGPINSDNSSDFTDTENEYYSIARVFAENGADALNFETFSDTEHILPAVRRIKEEYDIFVIVSFSVNQYGYSASGLSARRLIADAAQSGCIDAAGLNCGVGPAHMHDILSRLEYPENLILTALPNAGYPSMSRNRLQFENTPLYFAEKMAETALLGADIMGGCCGTEPSFIKELSKITDITVKKEKQLECKKQSGKNQAVRRGFMYDEKGDRKNKRFIAVELAPPFDADDGKLLESAHILKNAGVDVLTFPDSPSGRTRVDSVLMAEKVRRETGMEVMPHICCRDKNALAMRSTFMGAHINGINNMLIITGDPLPSSARKNVKAVFNFDSVGLMNIAAEMNSEIFSSRPLRYGGAVNQGRRNLEIELERVKRKMNAGAEFFMSQPVFSKEDAERLRRIKQETGACIFCGVMPLISRKNAVFMKNEIAGVNVTDEIIKRYPENGTKSEGEAAGVALAKEVIAMTEDFADGYYFTFPFNRVYLLAEIIGKK